MSYPAYPTFILFQIFLYKSILLFQIRIKDLKHQRFEMELVILGVQKMMFQTITQI